MSGDSPGLIAAVVVLVVLAAALTTIEAALSSFSRARAVELAQEQRPGAIPLLRLLDDPAHYLNALLVLRLLAETSAVVLSTAMVLDLLGPEEWTSVLAAIGLMFLMLFVVVGVGPRTIGRQRSEVIALTTAGIVLVVGRIMGPLPKLLILIGNAITPGKGFSEGPFSSEAELREMVDLAEASSLIESGESKMIHSVFELGDTSVREVMVPRTDVVYIERTKTLRQAMSLFLRSGFSRIPVVGEDLDDIVGFAYLKDISKRVFDRQAAQTTEQVESTMRPVFHVPDSKPVDDLLREMQAERRHIAVVVDEYGGTAGIATIEDILEEIVGEITDEFDSEEASVEELRRRVPPGALPVPGRRPRRDPRGLHRRRRGRLGRRADGEVPRQGAHPGLDRRGGRAAVHGRGGQGTPQPGRHRADRAGRAAGVLAATARRDGRVRTVGTVPPRAQLVVGGAP